MNEVKQLIAEKSEFIVVKGYQRSAKVVMSLADKNNEYELFDVDQNGDLVYRRKAATL